MTATCSAAILAGGQSRRMGTDKSLLVVGGVPLLQRVIDRVTPLELPLTLITNTPERHAPFGVPMAADLRPNTGALGGIYTALTLAASNMTLVVACDMPTLCTPLLAHMIGVAARDASVDAVVPRIDGHMHALHAVYRKQALPAIQRALDAGTLRLSDLLSGLRVRWIEREEAKRFDGGVESFANINTPDDLAAAPPDEHRAT